MNDFAMPAWPEDTAQGMENPRVVMGGNQPPLEERVTLDFDEEVRKEELDKRIANIIASAGRAPACDNEAVAKSIGDLLAIGRTVKKRVEELREQQNRPILNAQRALIKRANGLVEEMDTALNKLKRALDAFVAEQRRRAEQARRDAEEAARKAQAEAEAERQRQIDAARSTGDAEAVEAAEAAPLPIIETARVEAPKMRGELGTTISSRTVWRHEIKVPIKQLPKAILENDKVKEAVNQVIGAMVRGGAREIKGVRIWDDAVANIR